MDSWTSIDASITAVPGAEALCPPDIMYLTFSMVKRDVLDHAAGAKRKRDDQKLKMTDVEITTTI